MALRLSRSHTTKKLSPPRPLRDSAKSDVSERSGVFYRNVAGARLLLGPSPSILTILGLVWQLFDEEKFRAQNLRGYTVYWHESSLASDTWRF